MKVRPEFLPWAAGTAIPALTAYLWWLYSGSYLAQGFLVVFVGLTVYLVYFFRDPARRPETTDSDDWLAPADGVVRRVDRLADGRVRIVIFLSIFNVHINRVPVACSVEKIVYRSGQFKPAFLDGLNEINERNILHCRDLKGRPFEIWQIAGLIARRIHCWSSTADKLQRGERFGMIALGSRTDLLLPRELTPRVETGQIVRAGQTVVAGPGEDKND